VWTPQEQAVELIDWYRAHREIELFFLILKEGCHIEALAVFVEHISALRAGERCVYGMPLQLEPCPVARRTYLRSRLCSPLEINYAIAAAVAATSIATAS